MKLCIAYNSNSSMDQKWANALQNRGIDYSLVDLEKYNWSENITAKKYDFIIVVPHGSISYKKQMFDERIYIIKYVLNLPIYPSFEELIVYENKRMLSYWLKALNVPHPRTDVFYSYNEAKDFLFKAKYPIVAKSNIGAAASGVHIARDKKQALNLLDKTFKGKGLPRRRGPNFNKKNVYRNIFSKIFDLKFLKNKIQYYREIQEDRDRRNILFQEFIAHDYEWKNVRIGNSFFSHKKVVKNDAASGTGIKIFTDPPKSLLDFIKNITDKHNLSSLSIDVFETEKDKYLVNEVQTYFGQPYTYLMAIDNIPGRYKSVDGDWVFESGDFNTNHSCDLRLEHAIDLFNTNKL